MPGAEFVLASLVLALVPGTGVVYTVSVALLQGWRASVAAALGCTLGIVPHLLLGIFGLAAVIQSSPIAFDALKWLGALYMFYLAWGAWRDKGGLGFDRAGTPLSGWRIAVKAFLLNILNPKLSIFFVAFLPQFVRANGEAPLMQMLRLSGVFMLVTFLVFVLYGAGAHRIRGAIAASQRAQAWIQRGFAGAFVALGLYLAAAKL